ncbi:helix-turn-helix transcriptional regulator [Megasphaera paucivorans]|uniref:Helix-turn-helix n=1 Tax=Megasphaera paucivorans TaxID=349095 RepID=A0A1G9QSU5_9FIRM|nr:helix-turn-helix transcriptional regulator [Megasphaera paucivorans]SDM14098.1 Helix-turn-helix [Megasphaera paucivorans]
MSINLRDLIESQGYTIKSFAKEINIPYTTLISMLNKGIAKSSVDNVIKVATKLNIRVEDLADDAQNDSQGWYHDPEIAQIAEELRTNPKMRILFDASKDLNKKDIDFAINMINELKKKEGIDD